MIDSVSEFSQRLHLLDPDDAAFVLNVDRLVEETSPAVLQVSYIVIFQFFEAHPENDCGMPGTLVHMMEHYYPNYIEEMIESVNRRPSVNAVLMVNRILNSKVDSMLRSRLLECLRVAYTSENASPLVKEDARQYLVRHR